MDSTTMKYLNIQPKMTWERLRTFVIKNMGDYCNSPVKKCPYFEYQSHNGYEERFARCKLKLKARLESIPKIRHKDRYEGFKIIRPDKCKERFNK